MRHLFWASPLLFVAVTVCVANDHVFSQDDVNRLSRVQDSEKMNMNGQVELAPRLVLPFHLGFTTKGNGVLTIGGLGIRFYDSHRDLVTFAGGSLEHRLVDVDADGYKDLIFWGTVQMWDEKGVSRGERPISERPIVAVFHFNPRSKRFVNTVPDPDLYVFAQEVSDAAK